MAKDRAMFEELKKGSGLPALRIYRWIEPCISAGFGIPLSSPCLLELGLPLTKRPTGGGVVIHQPEDEITIALAHRRERGLAITELYRKIHEPFLEVLKKLGIEASMLMTCPKACSSPSGLPFCFDSPVLYDLVCAGKKILGGGLRLGGPAFLYQGTLKWPGLDPETLTNALAADAPFIKAWGNPIIQKELDKEVCS